MTDTPEASDLRKSVGFDPYASGEVTTPPPSAMPLGIKLMIGYACALQAVAVGGLVLGTRNGIDVVFVVVAAIAVALGVAGISHRRTYWSSFFLGFGVVFVARPLIGTVPAAAGSPVPEELEGVIGVCAMFVLVIPPMILAQLRSSLAYLGRLSRVAR